MRLVCLNAHRFHTHGKTSYETETQARLLPMAPPV